MLGSIVVVWRMYRLPGTLPVHLVFRVAGSGRYRTPGSTSRHIFDRSTTMSGVREPWYRNRKEPICKKIRSLLVLLTYGPSNYDQIAPKIEYWIEYALREDFVTVDELVEGVSYVAWDDGGSFSFVGRFLKEFQDTPHRSEHSRSFVSKLCRHVFLWFAVASSEDLYFNWTAGPVSGAGGNGFIRAASFVGHLIEQDLLGPDLVRRHLVKPLTNHHHDHGDGYSPTDVRANAIYKLLTAAGNASLQGLFEPEDVQVCFQILDARRRWINGFSPEKLMVCVVHNDARYWSLTHG